MLVTPPSVFVKVCLGEFVQLGRSVIDGRLVELWLTEFVALTSPLPRMIVGSAAAAPVTPMMIVIAVRTKRFIMFLLFFNHALAQVL
jgi:hypothetical protein